MVTVTNRLELSGSLPAQVQDTISRKFLSHSMAA
jgi:hypothetical protein